ncbi:MAG: plasmid recombination protein, partial [Ruminococcus sp.]|nr:plasmid recombination protein [Ruminococcus sp.]
MASNDWKKMTVHDASGMKRHNGRYEREHGEHENKQIDKSKSHLNLYIGCDDYAGAYDNMRTRVKEVDIAYPPKRKNKSDARIICAMIEIPCPQEIYAQGYETAKQFFNDVYQMYQDFFGEKNVHGGFVHFDEVHEYTDKDGSKRMSLPHMHALVSAYVEWIDRDKKTGETTSRKGINGKHFVTKGRMKELNKLVDDYCLKNFNVHFLTGEPPQRKSVEQL